MKKILIYEPAMCCSTGVCGPSVDKELLRVATVIENLTQKGADISRFNLSGQPKAFVENQIISDHLKQYGPDILPVILVDGQVAKTKSYPTNEEFAEWTRLEVNLTPKKSGCGCEGGCC